MAELQTKFSIGDKVFHAWTTTVRKRHKCPDCLDTRKWKATSPAGSDFEFSCPRCTSQFRADEGLSLDYAEFGPSVTEMTIGSVRVDTHDKRSPISYMCLETGVGSGSIYDESDLFLTHEEAMSAAKAKAAGQNVTIPWVKKQYDRSVRVSDYQLESAALRLGRDERISHSVKLQFLFDNLRNCESMDELREIVDGFSFDEAAA